MVKKRRFEKISCHHCEVSHLCLGKRADEAYMDYLDNVIEYVKLYEPGEHLFLEHDPIDKIFAVFQGACKDYWINEHGHHQVNEFYLPGDIIGLELLQKGAATINAVAIKPSLICVIPFNSKQADLQQNLAFKEKLLHTLCRKIENQCHYVTSTNAKSRVASFFLNLIHRLQERCKNYHDYVLPMTNLEISSKLGLANETLSRILSEFHKKSLLVIQQKKIVHADLEGLKLMMFHS
ncbi:MAG: fumarate/nitrate reduction transcriptional regulator Fnr [Gammaproteobacteria bacterium]